MAETPTPFAARADLDGEVAAPPPSPLLQRLSAAGRALLAVVVSALLGGFAWLIVMQKSLEEGWTDHDFNGGMGLLVGAEDEQVSRQGFYVTMAAWLVIAIAFDLASRIRRAPWLVRGLVLAGALLLLWGLVFGPLVASRVDEVPAGVFGADAGGASAVVALVASLAAGITLARAHALVRSTAWWEPKHFDLRESLEELFDRDTVPPAVPVDVPPGTSATGGATRPPAADAPPPAAGS